MNGDSKSFQELIKDSDKLKDALNGAAVQAEQLPKRANFKDLAKQMAPVVSVAGAIGTAIGKFVADSVRLTQRWGDEWAQVQGGISASYQTFVRQLSAGDGWDNLLDNMQNAYAEGKRLAAVLDEVFERRVSFGYAEAETNRYISEQQIIMRDASRTEAERAQAAQNIIDKEKKLATVKRQVWQQEAAAMRDQFKLQTGLTNDKDIDFLVRNYNLNRDIINQAREYNQERQKLQRQNLGGVAGSTLLGTAAAGRLTEASTAIAELDRNTPQAIKDVARLTQLYDKSSDELVKNMADAEIAVINIDTEANRASVRATSTLGTLSKAASSTMGKVSQDFEKYRAAVQSAVDVNAAFNGGANELNVRLDAMKSGIQGLIREYGLENSEVQSLIKEYRELNRQRLGDKLEAGPAISAVATTSKGGGLAGITSAVNESAIAKTTSGLEDTLTMLNSVSSAFGSLNDVVSESSDGWLSWISNVLSAVAQAIPAIVTLTAATKVQATAQAEAAVAGSASAVAGTPVVGPALAVAAAATIAASILAAISSLPKFAAGGIAFGPTVGMFGEYAGAAGNPEVVAPLDRLRSLIFGNGQGNGGTVDFRIKGRDLIASIDMQTLLKMRG